MTENFLEGVALVTGAGSGIARALALQLGTAGAVVAVADVNQKTAAETANAITAAGGTSASYALDVVDSRAVDGVVDVIERDLGPVTRLANVAGVFSTSALADISDDQWEQMLSVHLNGTFHLCRRVIPAMASHGGGAVVNTSSIFALRGQSEASHYAAAKGSIIGFSKSIARELGPRGITVNTIAPGFIDTDMTKKLDATQQTKLLERVPAGRLGSPEEVASLVDYLASEQAAYINGETIHINGGLYMG